MRGAAGLWAVGGALIASSLALTLLSHVPLEALLWGLDPIFWLVALMVAAGLLWMALPPLLRLTPSTPRNLAVILLVGLVIRLIYFGSEPILELDYHRYLWDGAAVGNGLNPYAVSPYEARFGPAPDAWRALAAAHPEQAAAVTYDRLRTIYPAVAQAGFALAHAIEPFSLAALRLTLLAFELAGLALLAALLRETATPAPWLALYWWNPLAAKELINSAHMEAILTPFLLAALLLAAQRRFLAAAAGLALAAGAKLWPVFLGALVLRGAGWRVFFIGAALMGALLAAMAVPIALGRLDGGSGFVAYAEGWERNAALFHLIAAGMEAGLASIGAFWTDADGAARLAVAISVTALAAWIALRPLRGARDLCRRALIVIAALFLLSPTGYPWYAAWFAPLLAILPWTGLRLLTALLPLYALRFYFVEQGDVSFFDDWIVWLQVGPALALLAWEAVRPAPPGEPVPRPTP